MRLSEKEPDNSEIRSNFPAKRNRPLLFLMPAIRYLLQKKIRRNSGDDSSVLILSFILSSALGIGTDAVAGEKERGTLAKLLLLPIPRNHIIIGKILSTTFLTILSALSSFIGIMASLPFLKTIFAGNEGEIIDVISYGASDVLLLLLVLLLLAALASSLLLLASTIAKTIKEASALAMPIFIGVMILPMVTMFSEKTDANPALYLIPFYNFILI